MLLTADMKMTSLVQSVISSSTTSLYVLTKIHLLISPTMISSAILKKSCHYGNQRYASRYRRQWSATARTQKTKLRIPHHQIAFHTTLSRKPPAKLKHLESELLSQTRPVHVLFRKYFHHQRQFFEALVTRLEQFKLAYFNPSTS